MVLLACFVALESEALAWCGKVPQACGRLAHTVVAAGYSVGSPECSCALQCDARRHLHYASWLVQWGVCALCDTRQEEGRVCYCIPLAPCEVRAEYPLCVAQFVVLPEALVRSGKALAVVWMCSSVRVVCVCVCV